jgi:RNA polymerase sigma-70 factor, ECF subfamily
MSDALLMGDATVADATLVVRARDGSVDAFELLVNRYHSMILNYLIRQTDDPEFAADLTQETFLDAYRSLDRVPEEASFAAWLYRIARNNLLNEWRRRRLRRMISLNQLLAGGGARSASLRQPDTTAATVERDLIQQVLNELSPNLREALVLSSLCGFTGREVADILGISTAAAQRRIGRAKELFAERHRALSETQA